MKPVPHWQLLIFRKPSPLPKYTAIVWPFTSEVWASIGISAVCFAFIYWVFSLLGPSGYGIAFDFGDSCWHVTLALLAKGAHTMVSKADFL